MELDQLLAPAQLIGFMAFCLGLIAPQFKKRAHILLMNCAGLSIWSVHYAMLGAWVGTALLINAIVYNFLFVFRGKHALLNSKYWLVFFASISITSTFILQQGWYSWFACAGSLSYICAAWMLQPGGIRAISCLGKINYLTFNIFVGSWAAIINNIFGITSICIAAIRLDRAFYKRIFTLK